MVRREWTVRTAARPMFRALKRLLQRGMLDPAQLTLRLFGPSDAAGCALVMALRDGAREGVHDGVKAPPVRRRRPRTRRPAAPPAAPPAETAEPVSPTRPSARRRRARPPEEDDAAVVAKLVAQHAEYNAKRFGGALRTVPIEVSPRMRSRLRLLSAGQQDDASDDHDQPGSSPAARVGRSFSDLAARDGASMAGGDWAAGGSWCPVPRQGTGGRRGAAREASGRERVTV